MDSPPDDGPCEVTITAPDREWLQGFVRQLVEDHLAAAAHVDIMETTYRWAGQIHQSFEARAVLHAAGTDVSSIVERTMKQHPFAVPCVVAKTFVDGSSDYLQWILDSRHPNEGEL